MDFVPAELYLEFALPLPLQDVLSFCLSNKKNFPIWNDEYFWHFKYLQNFGNSPGVIDNWKKLYKDTCLNKVWLLNNKPVIINKTIYTLILLLNTIDNLKVIFVVCGAIHTMLIDIGNNV